MAQNHRRTHHADLFLALHFSFIPRFPAFSVIILPTPQLEDFGYDVFTNVSPCLPGEKVGSGWEEVSAEEQEGCSRAGSPATELQVPVRCRPGQPGSFAFSSLSLALPLFVIACS